MPVVWNLNAPLRPSCSCEVASAPCSPEPFPMSLFFLFQLNPSIREVSLSLSFLVFSSFGRAGQTETDGPEGETLRRVILPLTDKTNSSCLTGLWSEKPFCLFRLYLATYIDIQYIAVVRQTPHLCLAVQRGMPVFWVFPCISQII